MKAKVCLVLGALSYASGASIHDVFPDYSAPDTIVDTGSVDHFDWKYDSQAVPNSFTPAEWDMAQGAATWVCNTGTMQSPIDIVTADTQAETTDPGAIVGTLFDKDLDGYLGNTGRALRYMVFGYARPTISGGALGTKVYALSHIDFHFGSVSTQGSEHTIDGTKYAMEMEMIFYDGSFASNADAIASSDADALVAISHFFTVDSSDNSALANIISEIPNIQYNTVIPMVSRKRRSADDEKGRSADGQPSENLDIADSNMVADVIINLETLLGSTTIDNYYYYDGSMTVPGCYENTKWIINPTVLKISEAQLTTLRTLQTDAAAPDDIADNFRPVQPLGTRTVYKRTAPFAVDQNAATIMGSTLVSLAAFHGVSELLKQPEIAKSLRENPLTSFLNSLAGQSQEVVQQRSSTGEQEQYHQYQQAVYQPQQYQQYVPQAVQVAPPAPQ